MRLSAKMLRNVDGVNSFQYADQNYIYEGQENEIYLQIVDLDKRTKEGDSEALPQHPLRYMPEAGATLKGEFDSLFDDEEFEVVATQPFPQDSSIWKMTLSAEQLPKTGNLTIVLTEGTKVKRSIIRNVITVYLNDVGSC